jgi:hypothetical protein
MDLEIKRYDSFADLEQYCYRVASVVGLLSIEIFGYTQPATREYADALGKALQLTNILRDVRADAERGRIYLPRTELVKHGVSEEEILRFKYSERFHALASSVATHARTFYQRARQTLPEADRRSMAAAELMGSVYWRLLRKLELQRFDVFGPNPTRPEHEPKTPPHRAHLVSNVIGGRCAELWRLVRVRRIAAFSAPFGSVLFGAYFLSLLSSAATSWMTFKVKKPVDLSPSVKAQSFKSLS